MFVYVFADKIYNLYGVLEKCLLLYNINEVMVVRSRHGREIILRSVRARRPFYTESIMFWTLGVYKTVVALCAFGTNTFENRKKKKKNVTTFRTFNATLLCDIKKKKKKNRE